MLQNEFFGQPNILKLKFKVYIIHKINHSSLRKQINFVCEHHKNYCFPNDSDGKESFWNAGTWVQSLGQEDPLEKEMATYSSPILAWRIPWTEEPGELQSQRV